MKKVLLAAVMLLAMTSCGMTFQNISTHGTASDLVDETQETSPTVAPEISLPANTLF